MIFVLDNINALIIGSAIILVVMAMQTRMTDISVEQTANYMMKRQAMEMATWMEDDLLLMGRNLPGSVTAYTNPSDSAEVTTWFEFYRDSVQTSGGSLDTFRVATRYELSKIGSHYSARDTVDSYRLDRYVSEGGGAWQKSGGSSGLLSYFKIEMLDRDAQPIANPVASPELVRNTRVSFHMVTPFERQRSTLRRVYYGSTLMVGS